MHGMTEASGERGRNRRIRKKGRPGKRTRRRSRPILIKAMTHPLRRRLLREINAGNAPVSPAQLAKTLDLPLGPVAYHANVLQRCGAMEVAAAEDG